MAENRISIAQRALSQADGLLINAGAGMGVDSGLPDFRGPHGFWKAYPVLARMGLRFEEMANPKWFEQDPELAWAFYGHRLALYRRTEPHRGFKLLQAGASSKTHGCFVFTSNVDGQFQKAGFDHLHLVECHGSIHRFQCTTPCCHYTWDAAAETIGIDTATFRAVLPLPQCPHCGAVARPNILMFNDWNWVDDEVRAQQTGFEAWLIRLQRAEARLAIIELGAGQAIPTVRATSERLAQLMNATLIRINPREPEVPPGHVGLPMGAVEGLDVLFGP